jgi:hypothetical protein
MAVMSGCVVSYPIIEGVPSRVWTVLVALLPVCSGCGAVWRVTGVAGGSFCAECMERSRASDEDELGGES